jgi:methionine biosynthesis protein MetW
MKKEKFYRETPAYKKDYALNPNTIDHLKTMASLMGKNGKVLDLGCGNGVSTAYLKDLTENDMYGIDLSPFNVKAAREKGIKARFGDVEKKLPFKNNTFDGVVTSGVIEHLFGHHDFLMEARRVLKPNGYLVLMTTNIAYWPNRILMLFGKTPIDIQPHRSIEDNQHIRFFTVKTVKDLLCTQNFKVEKCFSKYPQIPFLVRFSRKLGNPYINAGNLGFLIYAKALKN